MSYIKDPKGIEVRSFEIITEGLGKEHFKKYKKMIFTYFTKFYLFKIFIH